MTRIVNYDHENMVEKHMTKNMHKIYQCQRESYICDSVKEKKNTKERVHVESHKKFLFNASS